MKITFENQGANTYLVYKISDQDILDTMSLGMLSNNKIPGLAESVFTQMNTTKYLKYNVTAKVTASNLFLSPANKKRILGVFNGIVNAMTAVEDYAIDAGTILLDLDYIFVDIVTNETVLICLPVLNPQNEKVDLNDFLKNILVNVPLDPNENGDYMYKLLECLKNKSTFSLTKLKEKLREVSTASPVSSNHKEIEVAEKPSESRKEKELQKAPSCPISDEHILQRQETRDPVPVVSRPKEPDVPPQKKVPEPITIEPQISLFQLLQHYNKENAALYKAQKAAKKSGKNAPSPKVETIPKKTKENKDSQHNPGFDIPGVEKNVYAEPPVQKEISQQQKQNVRSTQSSEKNTPVEQQVKQDYAQKNDANEYKHQGNSSGTPDFGNTVYVGTETDDKTTFMYGENNQETRVQPHLIRKKNNEKIPINGDVFRLGRAADFNNYVIADNRYIGHSHCHIVIQNQEFFVVDDNSKNHTYLDGTMIPPNTEIKISHCQTIALADEEFEFRLF